MEKGGASEENLILVLAASYLREKKNQEVSGPKIEFGSMMFSMTANVGDWASRHRYR